MANLTSLQRLRDIRQLAGELQPQQQPGQFAQQFAASALQQGLGPQAPAAGPVPPSFAQQDASVVPEGLAALVAQAEGTAAPAGDGALSDEDYQRQLADLQDGRLSGDPSQELGDRITAAFARGLSEQPEGSVFSALGNVLGATAQANIQDRAREIEGRERRFVAETVRRFESSDDPEALVPLLMAGREDLYRNMLGDRREDLRLALDQENSQIDRLVKLREQARKEQETEQVTALNASIFAHRQQQNEINNSLARYSAHTGRMNAETSRMQALQPRTEFNPKTGEVVKIDPVTGAVVVEQLKGYVPQQGEQKPLTERQSQDLTHAANLANAMNDLVPLTNQGVRFGGFASGLAGLVEDAPKLGAALGGTAGAVLGGVAGSVVPGAGTAIGGAAGAAGGAGLGAGLGALVSPLADRARGLAGEDQEVYNRAAVDAATAITYVKTGAAATAEEAGEQAKVLLPKYGADDKAVDANVRSLATNMKALLGRLPAGPQKDGIIASLNPAVRKLIGLRASNSNSGLQLNRAPDGTILPPGITPGMSLEDIFRQGR